MSSNLVVNLSDGTQFPRVAFGTGTSFMRDIGSVSKSVLVAWDVGYCHFDTAKMYHTEKQLGDAIQSILQKEGVTRSDVYLTSKILPHVHKYEDVSHKKAF